jgi:hypothetical protein
LSYWCETPMTDEADYISVTLGSLSSTDLRDLEELGLLPKEALDDAESEKAQINNAAISSERGISEKDSTAELPWFETLVQGSKLGKMKTSRGRKTGANGQWTVEWEVLEWTAEDEEGNNANPAKRKAGDLDGVDSRMEH